MISAISDNRRKYPRIPAGFHVSYYLDSDIVPTTTENISRGGMRIITPRLMSSGKILDFIITFKGKSLEKRGRIVYISSNRIHAGIQFEKVLYSKGENPPGSLEQILLDPGYITEKILI